MTRSYRLLSAASAARTRVEATLASLALRRCQRVGARPRLLGMPHVDNQGFVEIGDDFSFSSSPVQSHLVVHRGATLQIGHGVSFSHGCGVACNARIEIGDGTRVGAFTMIIDSDFHVPGKMEAKAEPAPIRIGRNVQIGCNVHILRGAVIGDGAIIEPGSVVRPTSRAIEVAAGQRVSGVPARVVSGPGVRKAAAHSSVELRIAQVAMRTFRLGALPTMGEGRDHIERWDSLGTLLFIVALENEFGITLREEEALRVRRLGELVPVIVRARARRAEVDGALADLPQSQADAAPKVRVAADVA